MARREILELLRLAPGWDLYSSSRISTDAVARALELLETAMPPGCPTPSILPMARGGIQLEWHLRNLNIEVTIPPEGSPIEVWYEDLLDRSEHEFLVDDDLRPLGDVLTMLTSVADGQAPPVAWRSRDSPLTTAAQTIAPSYGEACR